MTEEVQAEATPDHSFLTGLKARLIQPLYDAFLEIADCTTPRVPPNRTRSVSSRKIPYVRMMTTRAPCNTAQKYAEARTLCREHGVRKLLLELTESGQVSASGELLSFFARLANGEETQEEEAWPMAPENACLGAAGSKFVIARNKLGADGQPGGMSDRHRFLTFRHPAAGGAEGEDFSSWWWFNVLVFGMRDAEQLARAIALLEEMEAAARHYVSSAGGWSDNVGLYFHCYGYNSVHSLHMHIVDLDAANETCDEMRHKNLPHAEVLAVLRAEQSAAERTSRELDNRWDDESAFARY